MKYISIILIAMCLIACKKAATKHNGKIIDLVTIETGVFRKKSNVAYTVIELSDGSRHRVAGDFGDIVDSITVWEGGGRVLTQPFEY